MTESFHSIKCEICGGEHETGRHSEFESTHGEGEGFVEVMIGKIRNAIKEREELDKNLKSELESSKWKINTEVEEQIKRAFSAIRMPFHEEHFLYKKEGEDFSKFRDRVKPYVESHIVDVLIKEGDKVGVNHKVLLDKKSELIQKYSWIEDELKKLSLENFIEAMPENIRPRLVDIPEYGIKILASKMYNYGVLIDTPEQPLPNENNEIRKEVPKDCDEEASHPHVLGNDLYYFFKKFDALDRLSKHHIPCYDNTEIDSRIMEIAKQNSIFQVGKAHDILK